MYIPFIAIIAIMFPDRLVVAYQTLTPSTTKGIYLTFLSIPGPIAAEDLNSLTYLRGASSEAGSSQVKPIIFDIFNLGYKLKWDINSPNIKRNMNNIYRELIHE